MLILSLLCLWVVAGADEPANQTNLDEIEKERLYEQQKLALEEEDQAAPEKERQFLEANPGYKDELDDPPTILVTGDDCSDPFIIPENFPYSHSDNTCNYADLCDIAYTDNRDVIYELTITSTVGLVVSLCGSSYDTKLAIYTPTCCSGDLDYWQYNDDSCGLQSEITATFTPGTYYIVVDGFGTSNCGDYTLNITAPPPPQGRCCYGDPQSPSCLDETEAECLDRADDLSWDEGLNCLDDPCPILPIGRCCYGDPYNPDCIDNVTEDDCLAGYSGVWTEGLDCDAPCPLPPPNDDCENAELVAVPSSTQGNTDVANGESFPFCGTSDGAPGVWYKVIGTGNTMTATTCNAYTDYDTKLRVYCHTCADPYCVGGNDDTVGAPPECDLNGLNRKSTVVWCSEVGTEYLIQVFGFSSYVGNFQLDVSDDGTPCQDPPMCAPPTGACCVYPECVDTNTWEECDAIEGGIWYAGEDCATFECPEPSDVPTLSEWGMIIFTLLLLSVGTVAVIRRRNTVSVKEAARS